MPYTKEHTARTRKRIVEAAAEHFKSQGYDAARIDDVMAAAGLTRGGFYAHFSSKENLFAAAVDRTFVRMREFLDMHLQRRAGPEWFRKATNFCLSRVHRDNLVEGCPLAGISVDVSRAGDEVRSVYTRGLHDMTEYFEQFVDDDLPEKEKEIQAFGMMAVMVGTVTMARGVNDTEFSDRMLKLGRDYAERAYAARHGVTGKDADRAA
jgi:TetR/AcrR family transcriptional repressor of nem operon